MLLKISLEASVSVIYGGIASRWKVPQGFHLLNLSDSDFQISSNKKIIFLLFHLQNLSDSDFKMSENKNTYFFLAKGANLYKRAREKANGDEGGEIE